MELTQATDEELFSALGEEDTPRLFGQVYKVDHAHDVPTGAGSSVDRKTIYIDRTLYQEVMDGEFKASDLTPQQIIDRWIDHEHIEICIVAGDNPIDTYMPAHERALCWEHLGVLAILGRAGAEAKIRQYETTIWPGLVRCYHRPSAKPPLDLWCGPTLDDPTERDKEILAAYVRLGVVDAGKHSKRETRYGMAAHRCRACQHWAPKLLSQEHGQIAACEIVNGPIRADRGCDLFKAADQ
jgi:hypothetical protein